MALNISPADNNHRRNAAIRAFGVLPGFISLQSPIQRLARMRGEYGRALPLSSSSISFHLYRPRSLVSPLLSSSLPGQIRLACESRDQFLRCAPTTRRKEVREIDSRDAIEPRSWESRERERHCLDISRHINCDSALISAQFLS